MAVDSAKHACVGVDKHSIRQVTSSYRQHFLLYNISASGRNIISPLTTHKGYSLTIASRAALCGRAGRPHWDWPLLLGMVVYALLSKTAASFSRSHSRQHNAAPQARLSANTARTSQGMTGAAGGGGGGGRARNHAARATGGSAGAARRGRGRRCRCRRRHHGEDGGAAHLPAAQHSSISISSISSRAGENIPAPRRPVYVYQACSLAAASPAAPLYLITGWRGRASWRDRRWEDCNAAKRQLASSLLLHDPCATTDGAGTVSAWIKALRRYNRYRTSGGATPFT